MQKQCDTLLPYEVVEYFIYMLNDLGLQWSLNVLLFQLKTVFRKTLRNREEEIQDKSLNHAM